MTYQAVILFSFNNIHLFIINYHSQFAVFQNEFLWLEVILNTLLSHNVPPAWVFTNYSTLAPIRFHCNMYLHYNYFFGHEWISTPFTDRLSFGCFSKLLCFSCDKSIFWWSLVITESTMAYAKSASRTKVTVIFILNWKNQNSQNYNRRENCSSLRANI